MGKVELDHTGSGGGITLSSDGTDLLLDGTAIGGGGAALELYAENPSTPTAPSATGLNAVAIGSGAVALGQDAIAMGAGANASTISSLAIGILSKSSGNRSFSGPYSYAFGADSFAAAISSNASTYGATGGNSVAIGFHAKASGVFSTSVGYGTQSTSGNSMSFGRSSVASGDSSLALGFGAAASGERSVAIGNSAKATTYGKMAYAAADFGSSSLYSQMGTYVLLVQSTDATPSVLTSTRFSPSFDNQVILPNNSAYAFHGTIVARQQASGGTACAAWKVEGLIRREGSAGTTVLVNSATTILDNTPAWGMALSADTTNGGLKIEVTGAAATNIRWVATINTSEVTY